MKPGITLAVLCALFSEVAALTCYQCAAGTSQTCTNTQTCSAGSCASMTVNAYAEVNTNTPNGKQCFTCEGDDCTKQLSCGGNEDRCVKATTNVSGQTVAMKGCASRAMCTVDLSAELGFVGFGLNCCKENLCNSAKSVGQSVLLLLGSLVSVLLFH
ncbi:urokinase plasminogen activator surface receptor-like isoform X2 [Alosa pseudoharengus]|uniref:urokinase plasminogen activator surface receptor-like isoform X2 n=1 Tax=Alosa pseudoharengus TaxID=34774 RepID=UPI003F8AB718